MYDNGIVIDAPVAGASMAMPLSYILNFVFVSNRVISGCTGCNSRPGWVQYVCLSKVTLNILVST